MFRNVALFVLLQCAVATASAAPVNYSFYTTQNPFGGPSITASPQDFGAFDGMFSSNATVSGTFTYDSSAPLNPVSGPSGLIYGLVPSSSSTPASFSNLSGGVTGMPGLSFSDARGFVTTGNDRPVSGFSQPVDYLSLWSDPSLASSSEHNFNGFVFGNYALVNVKLFWFETQMTPNLITDFLQNEDLLAAPPSFTGRLSFEFLRIGNNATSPDGYVFFDGLTVNPVAVPEPETLTLMLAGFGMMGAVARRRKASRA